MGKNNKSMTAINKFESNCDFFTKFVESELKLTCIREHKFHPIRKWRIDYFIPEHNIAIEVEGGAWTQGRHTRGKGFINDMEKYNAMTMMGIKLIRVTPDKLVTSNTISMIKAMIVSR